MLNAKKCSNLADGAVRCEPVSVVKFPDHQGKYREFPFWGLFHPHNRREKHRFDGHLASISLLKLNRELISSNRESTRVIRERIV
jgi:hypothetical protein